MTDVLPSLRRPTRLALAGAAALALTGLVALPSRQSAPAAPSAKLAAGWERGVALTDWSADGLGSSAAGDAIDAAMSVGADRVVLSPTLYVDDVGDDHVAPVPGRTPDDASVRTAIAAARSRGVAVTLKPHVDVEDGTPRSEIDPADRDAWFASYRPWILHYARLAAQSGVDTFVLGVELSDLQDEDAQWRSLAAEVRAVFHGSLTYAANWDATDLTWWDAVDLIGVDAYMPVTASTAPTDAQLADGWTQVREQLAALHRQWGKRVLLTEIGYPDSVGAAARPWSALGGPDPGQQAQAVEAAFRALARMPWLAGAYWWDWPVDPSQANDHSLPDSPAARVLASWQAPSGGPQRAGLVPDAPVPLLALALVGAALALGGFALGGRQRRPRAATPAAPEPGKVERQLLRALASYDVETAEHCERVGSLVGTVAAELGLPAQHADRLRRLGSLHDVGKLRVPLQILRKPGRLTPEERDVARRWGVYSAELVAQVPDLVYASMLLERACSLDESTPLDAQILAACDAYDSMTHDRPFRPAIPRAAVLAALAADRRLDGRIISAIELHGPLQSPEVPDRRRSGAGDDRIGPSPQRPREDRLVAAVATSSEP